LVKKGHVNSNTKEEQKNNDLDKDTIDSIISKDKETANKEKIKIASTSIAASFTLTIIKLAIGLVTNSLIKLAIVLVTNSLGLLFEALHSGIDVIAAGMTFYAVKMAMKPPDIEHNYGHGKFESLTSLA
jgi:divalent metal cation (Fe/Co/Zn/Cd) transporter